MLSSNPVRFNFYPTRIPTLYLHPYPTLYPRPYPHPYPHSYPPKFSPLKSFPVGVEPVAGNL